MPLLSPSEFRTRLKAYLRPTSTLDPTVLPLPHALLATVIAWGAKFSEHPLLVHDRDTNAGRSRICRILTRRAREVSEGEKIHRLPSFDNVIIALLLEPLQSRKYLFLSEWITAHLTAMQITHRILMVKRRELIITRRLIIFLSGFRGFWLNCGVRHLFELQVGGFLPRNSPAYSVRSTGDHI
jgi:hypothetical protein